MTIQQAIEKAIQGGWEPRDSALEHWNKIMPTLHPIDQARIISEALLQPEFWKALGKSMGWIERCDKCGAELYTDSEAFRRYGCDDCKCGDATEGWLVEWHAFIDHLAEGNSIESYFESL